MASISSYDSNSISILLSSLPGSSQKQSASSSLLSSIKLTDYTAIRTGSFGKLMKAYYAKVESELDEDSDSSKDRLSNLSTSLSGDSSRTLTRIKENTSHLNDTAKELYDNRTNSVFSKKDASGKLDTDAIFKKVSTFVTDYNDVIAATGKAETDSIVNAASSMANVSNRNSSALSDVGISINKKNFTLSIDEEKFKAADMEKVKALFHGTGSYAYEVATKSAMVQHHANVEANRSNTYTGSGNYSNNYNTGNILNTFM